MQALATRATSFLHTHPHTPAWCPVEKRSRALACGIFFHAESWPRRRHRAPHAAAALTSAADAPSASAAARFRRRRRCCPHQCTGSRPPLRSGCACDRASAHSDRVTTHRPWPLLCRSAEPGTNVCDHGGFRLARDREQLLCRGVRAPVRWCFRERSCTHPAHTSATVLCASSTNTCHPHAILHL